MSVVPSQILYLEHGSSRLYAEAIQVVDTRHLCWTRPALLIQGLPEGNSAHRQAAIASAVLSPDDSRLELYDLGDCPDLIWPLLLFQIAYDIDFFSLLIQLKISPDLTTQCSNAQFNAFIHGFWRTHASAFQPAELSSSDA